MKKVAEVSVFKGCSDNITKKTVPVRALLAPKVALKVSFLAVLGAVSGTENAANGTTRVSQAMWCDMAGVSQQLNAIWSVCRSESVRQSESVALMFCDTLGLSRAKLCGTQAVSQIRNRIAC